MEIATLSTARISEARRLKSTVKKNVYKHAKICLVNWTLEKQLKYLGPKIVSSLQETSRTTKQLKVNSLISELNFSAGNDKLSEIQKVKRKRINGCWSSIFHLQLTVTPVCISRFTYPLQKANEFLSYADKYHDYFKWIYHKLENTNINKLQLVQRAKPKQCVNNNSHRSTTACFSTMLIWTTFNESATIQDKNNGSRQRWKLDSLRKYCTKRTI